MKFIVLFASLLVFGFSTQAKSYNHCEPSSDKFKELMDDRERCSTENTENGISLYTALAEFAACEEYYIEKIVVVELYKTRGLSFKKDAPCIVKIKNASTSIGGGDIEVTTPDGVQKIHWDANHDLTSKNNSVKFWRDQLEPQIIGKDK